MPKIYDCFSFFNELDLLELRLNILDPYVDYFVITEANITHSGLPKPFYYEENKERFAKWQDKIIHVKVTDVPSDFSKLTPDNFCEAVGDGWSFETRCLSNILKFTVYSTLFNRDTESHYGRDFWQKESCRRGLEHAQDEDIVLFSDVDEIPNPIILKRLNEFFDPAKIYSLQMKSYYYYLNMLKENDWQGTRIGTWAVMKDISWNQLRRDSQESIPAGGWHFSFQGDADKVRKKIESYSHQELNTDDIKNRLQERIDSGTDPYDRGRLTKVSIDQSFPQYLRDNIHHYRHMIRE